MLQAEVGAILFEDTANKTRKNKLLWLFFVVVVVFTNTLRNKEVKLTCKTKRQIENGLYDTQRADAEEKQMIASSLCKSKENMYLN